MDKVPVAVEENVAVVSVLDLEEVRDERVAGERFGKVALCAREFGRGRVAVSLGMASVACFCGSEETHGLEVVEKSDMA